MFVANDYPYLPGINRTQDRKTIGELARSALVRLLHSSPKL